MHCPQSGPGWPGAGSENIFTPDLSALCMYDIWNGSHLGTEISFGNQEKRTNHGCHFAARRCSQRETPPQTKLSLSLWQCFSLNPLSYDRDAQCEVHIQICSNPSARKTYDFLVFTHRWPPWLIHPGPLWRSNGIPAPELIADQASKGQWPRLPVIIHTNLPRRGVDRRWVLLRQIEALGWVDLGGGHPTEFSNHSGCTNNPIASMYHI